MKKFRIKFSVPELIGREIHTAIIKDRNLEDTWLHVDILNRVYDLNVWQDNGPIEAVLYPTSITEKGTFTTDTLSPIVVVLHSVEEKRFISYKKIDIEKVWGGIMVKDKHGDWPVVLPNDDGIRPAGKPDECLYCHAKIGEPHAKDCVIVKKKVKVNYSFHLELEVPHCWTKDDIEFHRNDGTWCANNAISELEKIAEKDGCLCSCFECTFIEDVDTTPIRKKRKLQEDDETQ